MINELIRRYWPAYSGRLEKYPGGWNNTTFFVEGNGYKGIFRIYETHKDRAKIRFEHAVLEELQHQPLSFKVPVPVRTADGDTLVQLGIDEVKYACLFDYIEGAQATDNDVRFIRSFGEAAAELTVALASIALETPVVYPPYYELGQSYPLCNFEAVSRFCGQPDEPFKGLYDELQVLCSEFENILYSLEGIRKLPHQLVHGDLNASNLLLAPDDPHKVTALLDFEFCTWDVRVMEAAVILSGLLGTDKEKEAIRQVCLGYAGRVQLDPEEIQAIPVLMRLRKVDVFLHFMTRYLNGTDGPEVLQQQLRLLADDLKQLNYSSDWLEGELYCLSQTQ
jgi:Ser/Thr protein kinase RdoA (MazF antagonist)